MMARDKHGNAITCGTVLRFAHQHVLQTVVYSAKVVKLDGEYVWVEIPQRIQRLPFPPAQGKRYGKYLASECQVRS
jgi:hypothetical protein